MKICKKLHKTQKKCALINKITLKEVIFDIFLFKSQNFAQVVESFVQTYVCVSVAFRNSDISFMGVTAGLGGDSRPNTKGHFLYIYQYVW